MFARGADGRGRPRGRVPAGGGAGCRRAASPGPGAPPGTVRGAMLFDPRAHEKLVATPWDAARAEREIRAIARDADDALRADDRWWPVHPFDAEPGDPDTFHGIYLGAAGVLWALHQL